MIKTNTFSARKHIFRKSLLFNWKGQPESFNCDTSSTLPQGLVLVSSVTVKTENLFFLNMATVADQDSLQSAVKLVQITREAIKYLEAAQKVTDVLVSF